MGYGSFLVRWDMLYSTSLVIAVMSSFAKATLEKRVSKQGNLDTDTPSMRSMTDETKLGQYTEATC